MILYIDITLFLYIMNLDIKIDFDHASRMWRANKRVYHGCLSFKYCCGALKKDGTFCSAPPHIWKKSINAKRDFKYSWGLCSDHINKN